MKLVLYNGVGSSRLVYSTTVLSGAVPDAGGSAAGYGFVVVDYLSNGIQNGATSGLTEPDGLALVAAGGSVLQFLSYEGTFTAADGPAVGMTSVSIGVAEDGVTPIGYSLQLRDGSVTAGPGAVGTWQAAQAATKNAMNANQVLSATMTGTSQPSPSPTPMPVAEPSPSPIAQPTAEPSSAPTLAVTPIYEIQGAGHASPLVGTTVRTSGVVTARASNGFYLQDAVGDGDVATSDGLFVFTGSAPPAVAAIGVAVALTAEVSEYVPGNNADSLSVTELIQPTGYVALGGGGGDTALPAPVVIGFGGRMPPNKVIDDDGLTDFDPATDGIDFFESLEGMLVQVNGAKVVGPTNSFGEIWVVGDLGARATVLSARGALVIRPAGDFNPERLLIDDSLLPSGSVPTLDVGAVLAAPVVGPLDYNFLNYRIQATAPVTTAAGQPTLSRVPTTLVGTATDISVATFNVENLDPSDGAVKFDNLAEIVVTYLQSPDILSLEEVQDNNGATKGTVVDASITLQMLVDAVVVAGGPTYDWATVNPLADTTGGEPGGNIRNAFLYNPARVSFAAVDSGDGAAATEGVTASLVAGKRLALNRNPGLINPTSPAFTSSRRPLVGLFEFNGAQLVLVSCHFNSKGGDDALFGGVQPPILSSEVQRLQQAGLVNEFVKSILAIRPGANIAVLGDMNDFQTSPPLKALTADRVLTDLPLKLLPASERYTYVYQGNGQVLDHILASSHLLNKGLARFQVVHVNSEYSIQVSDHDPCVALFTL